MSRTFPSNKDHIIDELDDKFKLKLSDEEYDRLRKLTEAQLYLLTILFSRSQKNAIE